MTRKLAPKPWPDWFWCLSGGIDSTAAYLLTRDALHDNYGKRPVALYLDTRIGLPLNRLYLEELTRVYEDQLICWYTEEDFGEWVRRDGCPGPGAHQHVKNELKGRQASKLTSLASHPVYVIGLRAGESANRAKLSKVEQKRRHVEVYPVHELSKIDCARIILEADAPINPCWLWPHFTDCACLCNGDPSELDAAAERFPWFVQRMREIEEATDAAGLHGMLGWGGLTTNEQNAIARGYEQLTLCGPECGRMRDPVTVRAFKARIDGVPKAEAISILDNAQLGRAVA